LTEEEKPPADMPDLKESAKLQDLMPKTVSGIVTLDGKQVEGVRITDGVDFVRTGKDGKYSITLKPEPVIPYLPARTVSVCWPSGTWPMLDNGTGRYEYSARLKDIRDPSSVNFKLVAREVRLPMCVAFGTDPHDSLTRPHNFVFSRDIERARDHVAFAVMGGDLTYLGFGNADSALVPVSDYTKKFPVPLFHCNGNHDIVGVHTKWWSVSHETAGLGAFTKHLNPVRWSFDCAGIHFVGLEYARIDEKGALQGGISDSAIAWLEKDLASLERGTQVYFFNHQAWSPNQKFYELCGKYGVRLCLGGDSHRNMFLNQEPPKPGETEYWTKMSLYTLVYIQKAGFEFVDVCIYHGARTGWDGAWRHDGRACALVNDPPEVLEKVRGEHIGVTNVTLTANARELKPVAGATYDLRIGAKGDGKKPAKRWGLRVTGRDGKVTAFSYDSSRRMLDIMGLETPFDPAIPEGHGGAPGTLDPKEQEWVEMRIFVMPDRVRVLVNSRLHYEKFISPGEAAKIEFFAADGAALFGRVDMWQRTWKDYKPRRMANSG